MNRYSTRLPQEQEWATSNRDEIMGRYRGFAEGDTLLKPGQGGYGYDPSSMSGGGGGGGYSPEEYRARTANFVRAGLSGYTGEGAETARVLARGGEWDPRIRQGYGNFAETGGYSADDISNVRARAASQAPAFYDAVRNRMAQRSRAAGINNSAVFSAASDRLTRDSARAANEANLNAELGLQDAIRSGKLSGLSGLMSLDEASNTLRGTGMSGLLSAGDSENQVNMFNAGGENEMNRFNTSILNDESMFNIGNRNAAAAQGASSRAANDRWLAEMDADERRWRADQQFRGITGMESMWAGTPGELARQEELDMRERFGHTGNQYDNLSLRANYNPKGPSVMDRIMQGAGIVGGVAGAWMGGG
jgi:hypothetical protein